MTKKDYIIIADILSRVHALPLKHTPEDMWQACVIEFANTLKNHNPEFNRGKFIAACGIPNALGK